MADTAALPSVAEPFPIFKLAHRFLLYDASTVAYIRREYNICGVLIGGLPQAPQQNVFQGLPVELLPEEARLLVEKQVAFIVDDVASHKQAFLSGGLSAEERKAYQAALRKQSLTAAKDFGRKGDERKKAALRRIAGGDNWNDIPDDMLKPTLKQKAKDMSAEADAETNTSAIEGDDEALFTASTNAGSSRPVTSRGASTTATIDTPLFSVTPTTSYPPLQAPRPPDESSDFPDVPKSYPLFKDLHDKGYFLAPGLRFGCQYMAYPGDPLRFHSHFLCNGMDWDQEFDLLDLVGGGRLGTGVKKGFLIGGLEKTKEEATPYSGVAGEGVRSFCIEWGGM